MDNVVPFSSDQERSDLADLIMNGPKDDGGISLPPQPDELINLPGGLGLIEQFYLNRMSYPIPHLAGFMAYALMGCLLQDKVTIDSRRGLGFQRFILGLLPTGFGKEDLREPFNQVSYGVGGPQGLGTNIEPAPPGSKQGLHSYRRTTGRSS